MTTKNKIIIITLMILFIPLIGFGEEKSIFSTGYDLYLILEAENPAELSETNSYKWFHAIGYLNGYIRGLKIQEFNMRLFEVVYNKKTSETISICRVILPENMSPGQVRLIYLKWAQNHPEELHNPATACLYDSLIDAYGEKETILP